MTNDENGGEKGKPSRLARAGFFAVILFFAAPAVYVFSLGPVLWLCGARAGEWRGRLPRGVQAVYGPIVSFPDVPGWYRGWLSHFIRPALPREPRMLEVALSPKLKVMLSMPGQWAARMSPDGGPVVELIAPAPPNASSFVARLSFAPGGPDSPTRENMDKLLRITDAARAREMPEKKVNVEEMKSDSGLGAYAVFSIDSAIVGGATVYEKAGDGLFSTHGVMVRFLEVPAADLPQVVKFIGEGITVEGGK
jgi:hypothetical protein